MYKFKINLTFYFLCPTEKGSIENIRKGKVFKLEKPCSFLLLLCCSSTQHMTTHTLKPRAQLSFHLNLLE